MSNESIRSITFRIKSDKFIKLVNHHLEFLAQAGGYADLREHRDSDSAKEAFVPFKTAVEVADALVFNLLHGIELELKASLIEADKFVATHDLSRLIEELRKFAPASRLLVAVDSCFSAIRGLVGPAVGIQGAGAVNLAETDVKQWYEDMRYPERIRDDISKSDSLQFLLSTDEQWQTFAEAVDCVQQARRVT